MKAWLLGASGAWGRAFAVELVGRGYDLVALGRHDAPELSGWARDRGRSWTFVPFDLAAPDAAGLPSEVPDLVLVTAAATEGDVAQLVQANYVGVVRLVEHVLVGMRQRGRGRIGLLLGQNARLGLAGLAAYSASQAALWTWAEATQAELRASKERGVTLTRVFPPRTASATQAFLSARSGHRPRVHRPRPGPLLDGVLAGKSRVGRRPWLAALATAFR